MQGLSAKAIQWQAYGKAPATNGYAAFAGAFAILAAAAGLVVTLLAKLEKQFLLIDVLTAILLLAGGVAYAIGMRNVDCKSLEDTCVNEGGLITGGYLKEDGEIVDVGFSDEDDLLKRCKMIEANMAFFFLGFATAAAAAVIGFLAVRKAKRSYGTGSV